MKRVLIAYFSSTGKTETMAQYIAEGVRFSGQQAVPMKMQDIETVAALAGYDGFVFGSPTFSLDLPKPVKAFLSLVRQAELEGRLGGAFGSYRHDVSYQHDAYAPALMLKILETEDKMKPFDLGPFNLKEDAVETGEGMKACQDYGRVFGERLG